jgi:hypothetical protein
MIHGLEFSEDGALVRLRMHHDHHGFYADSDDVPGWVITDPDPFEIMRLANEAAEDPQLLGCQGPVDLRWQWCDDPTRGVAAIRWSMPRPPTRLCKHAAIDA